MNHQARQAGILALRLILAALRQDDDAAVSRGPTCGRCSG
jgi:hypothetical protein